MKTDQNLVHFHSHSNVSDCEDGSRPLRRARGGFYETRNKTQTVCGRLFIPNRSFRGNAPFQQTFRAWRIALWRPTAKGWYLYVRVVMETFKTVFLSRWVDEINERCPKSILGARQKPLTRSLEDWKVRGKFWQRSGGTIII